MAKFSYIARDKTGIKVTGVEESSSQEEIIGRLQAKGLVVVDINLAEAKEELVAGIKPEAAVKPEFKPRHYRVTSRDLVLFCRQLATLLGAGVTILKSLEIICRQVASLRFYHVIQNLMKNMEQGLSLHEAMAKHPRVFSELWINLAESGEASGNLAIILERLAAYLERNAEFKRKIISALIYPTILMIAGFAALTFLTVKIIPTFAELFHGLNAKLPVLTQIIVNISAFMRKFGLFILGALIVGFFIFRGYIKTKDGRRQWENFKFKLPVFGEFFRALVVERFASELSTLIESGVPILYSLEIAEQSVNNSIMAGVIRQVKEDVREGKPLSRPLEQSGFFEPMVVQMVNVGEEIGELSKMFKRVSTFYRDYVETFLARFASMFEPIMLIFMGLVIGIMVIGMFLPIFQIAQLRG
jgi:type II secretory pathway component PulF